jgi:threonine aldolase
MRQVGIVAAAAIYALTHNVDRLAEDHARARRLAEGLAGLAGLTVRPAEVETNIVLAGFDTPRADAFVAACEERGLLILALDRKTVRFVTHLDVDDAGIDRALAAVRSVLA